MVILAVILFILALTTVLAMMYDDGYLDYLWLSVSLTVLGFMFLLL